MPRAAALRNLPGYDMAGSSPIDLTILGSGSGVPTADRGPAAYHVQIGDSSLLLDSGAGAGRTMQRFGIDHRRLDYLFYTHLHPDHIGDLVPLLNAQRITPGFSRQRSLCIYAPRGFRRFFETMVQAYGHWLADAEFAFSIVELWEDRVVIEGGRPAWCFQSLPMNHSNCIGYRIESAGASLAYSGDTDQCENIIDLARQVDVLVLECSFHDDEKVVGHLTPAQAGAIANTAKCRTLLLTHFYPNTDPEACVAQCANLCDAEVMAAYDGMHLRIGG